MANWDEDSITMAVEAARDCLTSHNAEDVRNLYFASTTHPFKDRQNAGVIGTALSIEQNLSATDIGGSLKAGASALVAGLNASKDGAPSLVTAADKRLARVASANELNYGDGAAALLCGTENVIAKLIGHHSVSMDFVDHFRGDETDFDYGWEERWIRDEGYSKIVPPAIKSGLAAAKLKGSDITHFIMPSPMPAVPKQMAKACGVADGAVRDLLGANLGDTGCAHALVMLVDALETAKAGDKIMVVAFGQGVDVLAFEVTAENAKLPKRKGVSGWLARRKEEKNYMKFLAFNEMLPLDKGMRAEFDKKTALSVLWRKRDMIYGLVGGKCKVCGTVQFPRSQVCVKCGELDTQQPESLSGLVGRVKSYTEDWLAYTPLPPYIYGNVEYDGGANCMLEFTDFAPGAVQVGSAVRMVFRIKDFDTRRSFRRYFWKPAPLLAD